MTMTTWAELLPLIFLAVMGLALLAYVILDGYDLGVGLLLPLAENKEQKDTMIASIGPFWDANETWLVLGVGVLLVAFPMAHGLVLQALGMQDVCLGGDDAAIASHGAGQPQAGHRYRPQHGARPSQACQAVLEPTLDLGFKLGVHARRHHEPCAGQRRRRVPGLNSINGFEGRQRLIHKQTSGSIGGNDAGHIETGRQIHHAAVVIPPF